MILWNSLNLFKFLGDNLFENTTWGGRLGFLNPKFRLLSVNRGHVQNSSFTIRKLQVFSWTWRIVLRAS
jgi:hypothetical protein